MATFSSRLRMDTVTSSWGCGRGGDRITATFSSNPGCRQPYDGVPSTR